MIVIPQRFKPFSYILQKHPYAVLSTIMPNSMPQLSLVWFDFEGENIRINTVVGRQKDKNMQKRPYVALCIIDPEDNTRYIEVRGKVVERTLKGADEHVDELARWYSDGKIQHFPKERPDEIRVIYKIKPLKIRPSEEALKHSLI